jgi:hypothetical protein
LSAWATHWQDALDILAHPMRHLVEPPPGGEPTERLKALLAVRDALQVDDNARVPPTEVAMRQAAKIYHNVNRFDLTDRVTEVARNLDRDIAKLVTELSAEDLFAFGLVRTSDFVATRSITLPNLQEPGTLTGQSEQIWHVAAPLAGLPEHHPLRDLLPCDDCYKLDRSDNHPESLGLILGRCEALFGGSSAARPKAFYTLTSVKLWTGVFRRNQREQEEEAAYQRRQDEARERAAFWESAAGKAILAERELERLKREGKIPDLPPPAEPAVRVGRPKQPTVTEKTS